MATLKTDFIADVQRRIQVRCNQLEAGALDGFGLHTHRTSAKGRIQSQAQSKNGGQRILNKCKTIGGLTRYCRWCGSAFTETKGRLYYCSAKCEKEAKYRNHWVEGEPLPGNLLQPEVRICKTCRRPFVTKHAGKKYCSDRCRFHKDVVLAEMEKNGTMPKMLQKGEVQ